VFSEYPTILDPALALPTVLCGSENWKIKAKYKPRIAAAEMKLMRTAIYTWMDYKSNGKLKSRTCWHTG
jgi:hypothetical protein